MTISKSVLLPNHLPEDKFSAGVYHSVFMSAYAKRMVENFLFISYSSAVCSLF